MYKKIAFFVLLFTLNILCALPNFAFSKMGTSLGEEPIQASMTFSELTVPFENEPLIIDGEIMIPAETFFEQIKAQIYKMPSEQSFVAYKDNTFIKFKEGSTIAYLNGSKRLLKIAPFRYKGTLYIPFDITAQSFDIKYQFDNKKYHLNAEYRAPIHAYKIYKDVYYKSIILHQFGVGFYIPSSWSKLDKVAYQYGIKNEYQDFYMEFSPIPINDQYNRKTLFEDLKASIGKQYQDLEIKEIKTFKAGNFVVDSIFFNTEKESTHKNHCLYLIYEGNIGYVFTGHFNETRDGIEIKEAFDNIVSSFQLNQLTINPSLEYYVEFMPFFDNNMNFKSNIYSNMTVDNQFLLEGTLKKNSGVKGIDVSIERDGQRLDAYIPVEEGRFKGIVYVPFGTGKHNVTLALDGGKETQPPIKTLPITENAVEHLIENVDKLNAYVDEAIKPSFSTDSENVCVKFSVINVASASIKDTLPSKFINYDQPDVYATVNRLTYNLSSEYAKAKVIYQWLYDTYSLNQMVTVDAIRPLDQLIKSTEANPLELSVIQVGLMRALDIPSRIVRGQKSDGVHFWVETYINGKWLISDIANDIDLRTTPFDEVQFFNLNKKTHYDGYLSVEILPF